MTKNEAIDLLLCFFNARPPFASVRELAGHASSKIPHVFSEWLATLPREDQITVADALTESVLRGEDLIVHLPDATSLLADVAAKFPSAISPVSRRDLEKYIMRGDVTLAWLQDEDSETDHLKDYRSRWRFALCLWNALYKLKSPVALDRLSVFTSRAKDPEFARSLELAKSVIDNPPFGFRRRSR